MSIENFLSIKKKACFSLLASSDVSNPNNLIKTEILKKDESLLKCAVVYGANASGKSNILKAFDLLKYLVITSGKNMPGDKLPHEPFKLDPNCLLEPTKFEIVFIQKNMEYVYGVAFTKEKIIDEYLYYYPKGRKATIFERKNTNQYKFTVDKKIQNDISKRTSENVLYLSNSAQQSYSKTREIIVWFKEVLKIIGPTERIPENITAKLLRDDKYKILILKALSVADLGIDDVKASVEKTLLSESIQSFPKELNIPKDTKLGAITLEDGKWYLENVDIKTSHKVVDENGNQFNVTFDYEDESDGTRKMFSLIGPWIDSLIKGEVLIVDELDTKLHHFLNVFLIELFQDPVQNKSNAQLVFSTHNTNLLDQELFRRDQIWFTEKNPNLGNTELYSLVEFSPRKDKNIQKGYLAGRYGAVPFVSREKIL